MVGESGSPYVTPLAPLNSVPKYPPARATIVNFLQYACSSRLARGPITYPSKIYRLLDLSKASYALVRSSKITHMTSYLMAAIC